MNTFTNGMKLCWNCGAYFTGSHTCHPVLQPPMWDLNPAIFPSTPAIDDETKQLLRRIADALEKLVKQ